MEKSSYFCFVQLLLASYVYTFAIVISVIEQVKFLEMYPATKPWQSTFPQSADHISDVLRIRTHVLLMCFSCYAVTFLLYLLECALAYPLGLIFCFFPLMYRRSQKCCFRQYTIVAIALSKIIVIYILWQYPEILPEMVG